MPFLWMSAPSDEGAGMRKESGLIGTLPPTAPACVFFSVALLRARANVGSLTSLQHRFSYKEVYANEIFFFFSKCRCVNYLFDPVLEMVIEFFFFFWLACVKELTVVRTVMVVVKMYDPPRAFLLVLSV